MIDCRYKGTHKALTNYNYPGVCFTKYAPGPADQPNRSNLTAWPAKKASTASDSPHPLLPYSSRMTIPPGTRSGRRYFSAASVGSYTSKSKLRSETQPIVLLAHPLALGQGRVPLRGEPDHERPERLGIVGQRIDRHGHSQSGFGPVGAFITRLIHSVAPTM